MNYIKPIYKTITGINDKYLIANYGFKRSEYGATLRFPVYKYKNKPLIFVELIFDGEENQIHVIVMDNNGNPYGYNKEEYGDSKVIEKINNHICREVDRFTKEGIILAT